MAVTMISSEFRMPKFAFVKEPTEVENELLVYWKAYFETTYFLRISTFYFEWNKSTKAWEAKTSISRRVTCFLAAMVLAYFFTMTIVLTAFRSEPKDPAIYFQIATALSTGFYFGGFSYILWTKQDSFLEVFNEIQRSGKIRTSNFDTPEKNNSGHATRRNEILLKLFYCSVILIMALLTPASMLPLVNWDVEQFLRKYEGRADALFLDVNPLPLPVGSIVFIIIEICSKCALLFVDSLFISTTLLFRALVKQFVNELRSAEATPNQVVETYKNLKATMILINNTVGTVTFATSIGALPFYCEILTGIAKMSSLLFLRMNLYLIYLIASVVTASRSHKEVGEVYDWLYTQEKYKKIPHVDLHLLLYDISLNDIGLTAGGRPISYKLIGSILGLTATYVVLRFQFQTVSA